MSELQIGLIAVGVLLIVAVLGLNWWQDRRVRRRMQREFAVPDEDPLLGSKSEPGTKSNGDAQASAERREPGIARTSAAKSGAGADALSDGRREPAVFAAAASNEEVDGPDAAIEAVIDLGFAQPVPGESLLPLVGDLRQTGQKPIRTFYRTARGGKRASVRLDEEYSSMHLAVLLANRSGALTAKEWAQAWTKAQAISDKLEADIEGPDPREIAENARQLDELCAALDTSVGLTLVPRSPQPWRMSEILDAAGAAGFTESVDGDHMEWLDDQGAVRFTLAHRAANSDRPATSLNLLLDVPRSPASATAFADMAAVARQLAQTLDAGVVDDNGQPLAEGSDEAVDVHLRKLYAQLAHTGLPAGSARALRVFS